MERLFVVFRAGGFAEGSELGMEEFGGEGTSEGFDGFALLGREGGEFGLRAGELDLTELFGLLLEGFDRGDGVA